VLLLGGVIGAAIFHLYYLRLDRAHRCNWDHPLDTQARAQCQDTGVDEKVRGYAAKARKELDSLIGNVAN
jgi:hypothetical protein